MTPKTSRRNAMIAGLSFVSATLATAETGLASQAPASSATGSSELKALTEKLKSATRRRDFKNVPMILDHRDQWDSDALEAVIHYRGKDKQVWNNTELAGPWLNLMRNSLNAQVVSFRHPDFLAVSATHGSAHLALFDEAMWDKYHLADLAGGAIKANSFIHPSSASLAKTDIEKPDSAYGSAGNTIPTLQSRGVVFMACHNAIWEQTAKLIAKGTNPDKLSHEALAAELTNHLIEGVVLTPGIVATIPELQKAGFHYAA